MTEPVTGVWQVNADAESAYVQGEDPRKFFRYAHSMGQLFCVLRGSADLAVERQPWVPMAHNVPAFTADYPVLEMRIPADCDTVDTVVE